MQKNPRVYPVVAILIAPVIASLITIVASLMGKVELSPISLIIALPSTVLLLISAYKVYFVRKDALLWTTIALISVSLVYVLYIGLILVADLHILGAQNIVSRLIPAVVVFVGIWIGIHKSIKIIQASTGAPISLTSALPMKLLAFIILVLAILPTVTLDFYFTPQENETLIQTAITDNLVPALEYSVTHQNSFKGYQPVILNDAPKCSGSLIENISPDGSQVAVFGRSCNNPTVYYCSTLGFSMNAFANMNNFGQSMQTVPASLVSPTKFDCNPSASQGTTTVATPANPPTPGALVITFDWNTPAPQMQKDLVSLGTISCKENWPDNFWTFLCSVPVGKEDQIMNIAKNNTDITSTGRWWGAI